MDRDPHPTVHDVAIVGCGPTGATLANLLALQGLDVLVLEREPEIYPLPRAIHFDGESMRVFQAAGVAEELRSRLVVAPGMKFMDAAGRLLIDWARPTGVGPQGWHASYRFHQPDLEAILRRKLVARPGVALRLRHDAFALDDRGDHVGLRFEDMSTGRLLHAKARYVVGCDGARSLVRRFMGTELDDLRSHERWLVVDVLLKRDRPDLGDHAIQFCNPARPATYVRGVGNRRRWELMLVPGDDPTSITRPESVWRLLAPWVGPDDAELERPALYTFHSVVARGWRSGRFLIAGDAAHQTPPFLGQGMCAGVRDAANLAWKLARVIRWKATEDLLDTYESERSPHVRTFIETAVRLGRIIQTTDPEVAKRRDEDMVRQPEIFSTPQPSLGPGAHAGGGTGGRIAPQPIYADGSRLDDRVGYQYAMVVAPELADRLRQLEGDGLVIITADHPALEQLLSDAMADAVLVRPDRYIAGVASGEREAKELAASPDAVRGTVP